MSALKIYNLFPRYYENILAWSDRFAEIKDLGFNALYINPFHFPGFSGSLYAPKDYYAINPVFIDMLSPLSPNEQLSQMLQKAHEHGFKVIMDLVINHSSKDHPLTEEHPDWYIWNANGKLTSPGAWEDGQWVEWGDLAQINNHSSADKDQLWLYWEKLVDFYIDFGFDGFRADAAYQVPMDLWKRLIKKARTQNPAILFLGESLGCTPEQMLELAQCGFDYLFNSAKWWDMESFWFYEQHKTISPNKSIGFPESHDTQRIAQEMTDLAQLTQKIAFTGTISSAWMILDGTEKAWLLKPNVVTTGPEHKEPVNHNFSPLVKSINSLRDNFPILNEEGLIDYRDHENTADILVLERKSSDDTESMLYIINKISQSRDFSTLSLKDFVTASQYPELIFSSSLENTKSSYNDTIVPLKPFEIKIFYCRKQ